MSLSGSDIKEDLVLPLYYRDSSKQVWFNCKNVNGQLLTVRMSLALPLDVVLLSGIFCEQMGIILIFSLQQFQLTFVASTVIWTKTKKQRQKQCIVLLVNVVVK